MHFSLIKSVTHFGNGENVSDKYKKIQEKDVVKTLINVSLDLMSPVDNISLKAIANILKTSRYQVKKHIDKLVKMGAAEYSVQTVHSDEEIIPPLCGYRLADTIRHKGGDKIDNEIYKTTILQYRAMYQRAVAEETKLREECFGIKFDANEKWI